MTHPPTILVFDSGLGGLTVFTEIMKLWPQARLIYAADDAAFPYGRLSETEVIRRVEEVLARLIDAHQPQLICLACNTASTIALKPVRLRFPLIPFVGTVPAIKPAARLSRSRMITVLATPGTVAREYTHDLVRAFAGDCTVNLIGSHRLAALAERYMQGEAVADSDIADEIAPCFSAKGDRRTDVIVLACTHYPLLRQQFERLAPWPVQWIDPAAAIARRVDEVLRERGHRDEPDGQISAPYAAFFSSGRAVPAALATALRTRGLVACPSTPMPLRQSRLQINHAGKSENSSCLAS
jgi:glutamate racemase